MMEEKQKQNDAFVSFLSNPNATVKDYLQNGITAENTQLLSLEEYKETPLVKKKFSDENGVFNQDLFEKAYTVAAEKYFELGDEEGFQNFLEYSPTSRYSPIGSKMFVTDFSAEVGNNPTARSKGLTGLHSLGKQYLTEEELAQQGKIWDSENKRWLPQTAESRNIFKKAFGKTLVYAKYDTSGYQANPVTGEMGLHYEGEWMTDENGSYFTMTVNKDELGNKQVVAFEDILTKENSWLNKIDFFDSDGYEKSIVGVTAKTLVHALPYLIPQVRGVMGAVAATVNLVSVMPTFYKALEGIITGDERTSATKGATSVENWFKKFDNSFSKHGREHFFSYESMMSQLGDVFGQLYQQRAAYDLAKRVLKYDPSKFKNIAEYEAAIKKLTKTGQAMSIGYMALTSTANIYGEALNAGYDRRTAGLAAIASALASFGIMNYNETARGIGTWFTKAVTGEENLRYPVLSVARKNFERARKIVNDNLKPNSTQVKAFLGDFWADVKYNAQGIFSQTGESIWRGLLNEAAEEVSEEVIQDAVKGVVDTLSYLGFTGEKGSFGGWSNVFSKEGAMRYLQTAVAGGLGGGLFALQQFKIEPWMNRMFKDPNYKTELQKKDEMDLVDISLNGQIEDYIKELKNIGKIMNTKRGITSLVKDDGTKIDLKADGQTNQADMVISDLIDQARALDTWVKGFAGFDNMKTLPLTLREQILKNFGEKIRESKASEYLEKKFEDKMKQVVTDFTNLKAKELAIKNATADVDITDLKNQEKEAKEAFESSLKEVRGFFNGETIVDSMLEISLLGDGDIMSALKGMTEEEFYNYYFMSDSLPTPYSKLTEEEKAKVTEAFDQYKTSAAADVDGLVKEIPKLSKLYINMLKYFGDDLNNLKNLNHKGTYLKNFGNFTEFIKDNSTIETLSPEVLLTSEELNSPMWRSIYVKKRDAILLGKITDRIKANPISFNLQALQGFDLASKLESSGTINLDGYNETQSKLIKDWINYIAIKDGMLTITQDYAQSIINFINQALANPEANPFALKIKEEGTEDLSPIEFSSDKFTDDIQAVNIHSIFDLISDGKTGNIEITSEIAEQIRSYVIARLYNMFISSGIKSKDGKDLIENLQLVVLSGLRFGANTNLFSILKPIFDFSDLTPDLEEAIKDICSEITNFTSRATIISEDLPLNNILQKISSIIGFKDFDLLEQLDELQDQWRKSNFTGDQIGLTNEQKEQFKKFKRQISIVNIIAEGARSMGQSKGINEIQREFLTAYKNKKDIDKYPILDNIDYDLTSKYIGSISYTIDRLLDLDSELNQSKEVQAEEQRNQFIAGYTDFLNLIKGKAFQVEIPDDEGLQTIENIVLVNDSTIIERSLASITLIETEIANVLRQLRTKFKNDESYIEAIVKMVHSNPEFNWTDFFGTSKPIWESFQFTASGAVHYVSGRTIVNRLIQLAYSHPKEEYTFLNKIYSANPDISPKIDQTQALLSIKFALNHKDKINILNKAINELKNGDTSLIDKQLLDNITVLLGAGGSGKTLLATLVATSENPDKILMSALNEVKVNDLKQDKYEGDTLYNLIPQLENLGDTFLSKLNEVTTKIIKTTGDFTEKLEEVKKINGVTVDGNNVIVEDGGLKFTLKYINVNTPPTIKIDLIPDLDYSKIKDKVLIVDECTLLSPVIWKALSNSGATVIALGDPFQNSWKYEVDSYNIENYEVNTAGFLRGAWRADNTAILDFNTTFYKTLLNGGIWDNDTEIIVDSTKLNTLLQNVKDTVIATYSQTADGFRGVKLVDDIKDDIAAISNLNGTKAIITDLSKDQIEKEFGKLDGWEIVSLDTVQGKEYDYTIVYELNGTQSISGITKVFTATTRAKKGQIIHKNSFINSILNIDSKEGIAKELIGERRGEISIKRADEINQIANWPELKEPVTILSTINNKGDRKDEEQLETPPNSQTWISAGFISPIGIETWFFRLGVSKDFIENNKEKNKTLEKWKEAFDNSDETSKESDLYHYIMYLQETNPGSIKTFKWNDLINEYRSFRQTLFKKELDDKSYRIFITKDPKDDYQWAADKLNDNEQKPEYRIGIALKFGKNIYRFTLGGISSDGIKTISSKEKINIEESQIIYFRQNKDKEQKDAYDKLLQNIGACQQFKNIVAQNKGPFRQYTSPRWLKVDTKLESNKSYMINNMMKLEALLENGWQIVTDPNLNLSTQAGFLEGKQKYNLKTLTENIGWMHKYTNVVIQYDNDQSTRFIIPLFSYADNIIEYFKKEIENKSTYAFSEDKGTNSGKLRKVEHTHLLKGLAYINGINAEIDFNDNNQIEKLSNEIKGKYEDLELKKQIDILVTSLKQYNKKKDIEWNLVITRSGFMNITKIPEELDKKEYKYMIHTSNSYVSGQPYYIEYIIETPKFMIDFNELEIKDFDTTVIDNGSGGIEFTAEDYQNEVENIIQQFVINVGYQENKKQEILKELESLEGFKKINDKQSALILLSQCFESPTLIFKENKLPVPKSDVNIELNILGESDINKIIPLNKASGKRKFNFKKINC